MASRQLILFRRAIRDGATLEEACAATGTLENGGPIIGLAEGRIILAQDEKNPPPPEPFELIGHNRPPETRNMANATDDRLRLLIERVERLEEEKKGIADDISSVYAEAKAVGYDAKVIRKVIKLRKMKRDEMAEMDALLATYCAAVGLQLDLPLAVAA